MRVRVVGVVVSVLSLVLGAATLEASSITLGSSYHVSLVNFPVDGSADPTFDLTTKTVNTNLTVTERLLDGGPGYEWIDLAFRTIDGGPLASNPGAGWRIDVSGLQAAKPGYISGYYFYWSVDGVPVDPITAFGGYTSISPIPDDPSAGDAYVATGFPPLGPLTEYGAFAFSSPYSFISFGGINPSTANGFNVGIRVTALVPEPSLLALAGLGIAGAFARVRGRRRSN